MPYGQDYYLKLTAPNYVPQEYYFGGPMIGAPSEDFPDGETVDIPAAPDVAAALGVPAGTILPTPVVRGQTIVMLAESQIEPFFEDLAGPGAVLQPDAGLLALRMIDCYGNRAGNVSLSLDANLGAGFGFVAAGNNILRRSAEINPAGTTEPRQGGAGFANIPPGNYSPIGVLEDGRTYGGDVAFRVRAGQFTNGEIRASYPYGR